jgi:surfeit locus 1 family protein
MHPPATAGLFSASDDIKGRRFYTLDPARIGAALGVGPVAPFVLVALGPPGSPDPARALPRPPNDHLSYALTWFGLAAGLVGVFIAYARKALRKP